MTLYIIIAVLERLIKFQIFKFNFFTDFSEHIASWYTTWFRKCHNDVKTNYKLCTILFITNKYCHHVFFNINFRIR